MSEAPKDSDELSVPFNNTNPAAANGIETPETETNIPDQEKSVTSAGGAMDLD